MTAPSVFTSHRRYCLLKAYAAIRDGDGPDLGLTWFGKQAAASGTALADDFPSRAALVAAHYSTEEDLDGATVDELVTNASLSRKQATAALAAL